MNILWSMVTILIATIANRCGLCLKKTNRISSYEKSVIITTDDPDDSFSRVLRKQLCHNDFKSLKESINYPEHKVLLHIVNVALFEYATSRYHGNVAELQIIMKIKGTLLLSGYDVYPISLQINSSRYKISSAAFTDTALQESIISDMYEKAAQKLIHKLERKVLNRNNKIELLL